jgi:hypothetical protein
LVVVVVEQEILARHQLHQKVVQVVLDLKFLGYQLPLVAA